METAKVTVLAGHEQELVEYVQSVQLLLYGDSCQQRRPAHGTGASAYLITGKQVLTRPVIRVPTAIFIVAECLRRGRLWRRRSTAMKNKFQSKEDALGATGLSSCRGVF